MIVMVSGGRDERELRRAEERKWQLRTIGTATAQPTLDRPLACSVTMPRISQRNWWRIVALPLLVLAGLHYLDLVPSRVGPWLVDPALANAKSVLWVTAHRKAAVCKVSGVGVRSLTASAVQRTTSRSSLLPPSPTC